MKGNDGRAARRLLLKRVTTVVSFFVMFIGTLHMTGFRGKRKQTTQQEAKSSANLRKTSLFATPPTPKVITLRDKNEINEILSASIHLVDLSHDPGHMKTAPSDSYRGVYGEFCQLNFDVHKSNPSSVPMFRDVVAASPDCAKRRYKVNLHDIVTLAREHDDKAKKRGSQVPKSLELKAAVFHESRCGSTLVANALIGMDPQRHRVYSESAPPLKALTICGGPPSFHECSLSQAAAVLKDVVYLMGRTNDQREERLFFKIQSAGTNGLRVFQTAFPTTPWLFVYRDPVQVMMSHLKDGAKHANCVRTMTRPSATAKGIVERHGYQFASDLSKTMYCAVHLAAICETALEEMKRTKNRGMPVNYDDLPDILHSHILPEHVGISVSAAEVARIQRISSVYSKGRDSRAGEWHEDSEKKEQAASDAVKTAASTFLQYSYDELQSRQATVNT